MVCVDLVGQLYLQIGQQQKNTLLTFKMIDPEINTSWFEIIKSKYNSATSIQDLFHNTWLARYPQPQFIVFDNGNIGEFKRKFKQMCEMTIMALHESQTNYKSQPTSKCNH
jgi:hypothetical protein